MLYQLARSALFQFSPEASHDLTLKSMQLMGSSGASKLLACKQEELLVNVMGIDFPNPVGLAAGLDKNAVAVDAMAALGFGFVEVGTVTPRPQPGNPKPRLFRLPQQHAIINRMGFNNLGVDAMLKNIAGSRFSGVLGINIGKNIDTPVERALDDYLLCMRKVYDKASYITVNVSSPNTPGLRNLQFGDSLNELLESLKEEQGKLAQLYGKYVPVAVKIAPDMNEEEFGMVAESLKRFQLDGVIATNTTLSREGVEGLPFADEAGGLSGAPVRSASTRAVRILARELDGALPIIGVGGITDGFDAREKIEAGASLVQIYSGFIYQGPALIKDSVQAIAELQKS